VDLEPLYAKEAEKRMLAGKRNPGPTVDQGRALGHAAEAVGTSRSGAAAAKAVKKVDPAKFAEIKAGKVVPIG
jgi:hypothetical protein